LKSEIDMGWSVVLYVHTGSQKHFRKMMVNEKIALQTRLFWNVSAT
jgi:hypothetical protein